MPVAHTIWSFRIVEILDLSIGLGEENVLWIPVHLRAAVRCYEGLQNKSR